jgi:hypothetical protein
MAEPKFPPDIKLDGISPDEAFALLGNNTRLAIIQVLWKAGAHHEYDDIFATDTTISFSELRRAVNIRDNGQFNYHLSKLVPHFVRQTDDGYRLSGAGKEFARAVVSISGDEDLNLSDDLQTPCPLCDGPLTVAYGDQWLRVTCTDCPGEFGDSAPDGTIFHAPFPRAALTDRSPDDALSTGLYRCMLDLTYLMQGICRECTSPVTASVSICEEHDVAEDHFCRACGTPVPVWGDLRCDTCRFAKRLPVEVCAMGLTPVIAFLYERGIDVLAPSYHELTEAESYFRTTVSRDPLRISITITDEPDELTVTFDDELTVVDLTH